MLKADLQKRFSLNRLIGEGMYSKVYDAVDLKTGARCALKVFLDSKALMRNEESELRFLREMDISEATRSGFVVGMLDRGGSEDFGPWYTMELMDGSLRDLLISESISSIQMKCCIAVQCLLCLECIHDKEIIHRDIKPENFLYKHGSDPGMLFVYLTDFGYSRQALAEASLTSTGIGSMLYASPEAQYLASNVTKRSDLFSMGKILYEIFTNLPYGDVRDPKDDDSCPPWLFSICLTAAHNSPSSRPENVFELAASFIYSAFKMVKNVQEILSIIDISLRIGESNTIEQVLAENGSKPLNVTDILIVCAFPFITDDALLRLYSDYMSGLFGKFDGSTQKAFLKIFAESIANGQSRYISIRREDFLAKARDLRCFAFSALDVFLYERNEGCPVQSSGASH